MSGLQLYNHDLDENCYKVRLLLSLLKLEAERITLDVMPGSDHLTAAYRRLNPLARLPLLIDDGLSVFGTEAILAHLARNHDPSGLWLPGERAAFAQTMIWLNFSAFDLAVTGAARQTSLFEISGDLHRLKQSSRAALRLMDDWLTHREFDGMIWFAASHPTIADVALFPAFALSRDFGIDHDEFAALRRWARRFRSLPGFITMPGIPDYH